jgi:hypothetical protein
MFKRRRSKGPATIVGQYLRAGALLQAAAVRNPLRERLRETGWHDADSVAGAAFEIAVRHAYGPGARAVDIPEMVNKMREFFGPDGVNRVPQAEGEALIRAALGEDVSTDDIPLGVSFMVHSLIFVDLALDLHYSEAEIDAIILRAEETAAQRDSHPLLCQAHDHVRLAHAVPVTLLAELSHRSRLPARVSSH